MSQMSPFFLSLWFLPGHTWKKQLCQEAQMEKRERERESGSKANPILTAKAECVEINQGSRIQDPDLGSPCSQDDDGGPAVPGGAPPGRGGEGDGAGGGGARTGMDEEEEDAGGGHQEAGGAVTAAARASRCGGAAVGVGVASVGGRAACICTGAVAGWRWW